MHPDLLKDLELFSKEYMTDDMFDTYLPKDDAMMKVMKTLMNEEAHSFGQLFMGANNSSCPACKNNLTQIEGKRKGLVCHACGLESHSTNQTYHVVLDEMVWKVSKKQAETDLDLLVKMTENQKAVFFIYQDVFNGGDSREAEKKLKTLKEELEALPIESSNQDEMLVEQAERLKVAFERKEKENEELKRNEDLHESIEEWIETWR